MLNKKYQIIYADPPWNQSRGGKKSVRENSSGIALEYPVLPLNEISNIMWDVLDYADYNCVMFLWTIDKYLFEAEKIANDIGFKLHARMIWDKVTGIPAAFTIRFGHEYLLYTYRNKLLPVAINERGKIHSVFHEQVKRHSQKPDIAYEIIERLYPNTNRLELFARNKRDGWDSWGNEIKCDIKLNKSN